MEFSDAPVLQYQNVAIFQDHALILNDVNFAIRKGEFVYLVGRTGSGKSSLMKSIYADLKIKSGLADVAGFDLTKIKSSKIPMLRRKIGIVFQDFQLLSDRNVSDNLLFVLKATGWDNRQKMKARVNEVLLRVGLTSTSDKYPLQLSGGEQQRVVIARALLNEPALLIADEPTGNLDPEVSEGIMRLFLEINKSGTSILMATHNLHFLEQFPARVLVCKDRKIEERITESTIDSYQSSEIN